MTDDVMAVAKYRLFELTVKGWSRTGALALSEKDRAEAHAIALLLAPNSVPGPEQRWADDARLSELNSRALTPGFKSFTEAQEDEIVEIVARRARFNLSPEGIAHARLSALSLKRFRGLTPAEQAERLALEAKYPIPVNPNDPLAPATAAFRAEADRRLSGNGHE